MKRFIKILSISSLMMLTAKTASASTVGDSLTNLANSFTDVPLLFSAFAYIFGAMLGTWAMFTFREHVDGGPGAPPLSSGVKKLLAGGMMLALPTMLEAAATSWIGSGMATQSFSGTMAGPAGTPSSLDEMAVAFISDISGPMGIVLSAFAYIGGVFLILVAISRITRSHQEGARGPTGIGTIMTLLAGGALLSSGEMMGTFSTSLFGDATSSVNPVFTGSLGAALGASAPKVAATIQALIGFIVLVGWIAFIRGWFVLKAVADGDSQVSMTQALTFLFGGALAVNIGDLINYIQNSVGVGVLGISFS
ncbi:MAG: hypothetical protein ACQEQL_03305 [Pseudomonadota bacterium]